jgi:SWI/SNF related-matrix-associated actin-dependent regulator of chromatin subfamily C
VCSTNYYYRSEPIKKSSAGLPSSAALGAVNICPLCYADGRFPPELSSIDFIHIDTVAFPSTSTQLKSQPWSDKEILSLLDAVEAQKESYDWDDVSLKVGRPRDQCILQFLKLPTVECAEALPADLPIAFPFANLENPVMSTVAFLASMVHPKVAAAAASAAMAELSKLKTDDEVDPTAMDVDKELSGKALQHIAATVVGTSSALAKSLGDEESNRTDRLRELLVELQLQKVKAKLNLFEELEKSLEADKKDVEQQRLQLFIDRFNLRKMMIKAQGAPIPSNGPTKSSAPNSSNLTRL